jgi:hypothetical protein
MKRLLTILTLALALCGLAPQANAASVVLCRPDRFESGAGGGSLNLPNLSRFYAPDAFGCLVASGLADIAVFKTNGWTEVGKERSLIFTTGVATGTTNFVIGNLPAGAYIQHVIWNNTTANAAGNVALGSTSGGVDIVAAVACAANCLSDTTIAKTTFSATAATPLNLSSTAWGSASLNVTIVYGYW